VSPRVAVSAINTISNRIIKLTAQSWEGHSQPVEVFSAYAPPANHSAASRISFYKDLTDEVGCSSMPIVGGDFNAVLREGSGGCVLSCGQIVDDTGEGTALSSDLLGEFCHDLKLVSAATTRINTCRPTWVSAMGGPEYSGRQIDHVMLPKRWFSAIGRVRTRVSPVNSDHSLVWVSLKLKMRSYTPRDPNRASKKPNWRWLVRSDKDMKHCSQEEKEQVAMYRDYIATGSTTNDDLTDYTLFCARVKVVGDSLPRMKKFDVGKDWNKVLAATAAADDAALLSASENPRAPRPGATSFPDHAYLKDAEGSTRKAANDEFKQHRAGKEAKYAWSVFQELAPKPARLPDKPIEEYHKFFSEARARLGAGDPGPDPGIIPRKNLPLHVPGPPTVDDWVWVAGQLPAHKAIGPDGVPNMVLRIEGVPKLMQHWGALTYSGNPPKQWLQSETVPLYKKGDRLDLKNYRQITLASQPGKAYNLILLKRLQKILEPELRANQNGFRPHRGTQGHILSHSRIAELVRLRSWNKQVALLYVDFSAAFDSVYWGSIENVLMLKGVAPELIMAMMALYKGATTVVRTPEGPTDPLPISAGVLQGDTLAPYLFIIMVDEIMREVDRRTGHHGTTFQNSNGQDLKVFDLNYADDIVIAVGDCSKTQEVLTAIQEESIKFGLKINCAPGKTEIVYLRPDPTGDGEIPPRATDRILEPAPGPVYGANPDGSVSAINVVSRYKHLGAFSTDWDYEINRRMNQATAALNKLMPSVRAGGLDILCRSVLFNCQVTTVLLYGLEACSMRQDQQLKIRGCYTKLVRRMEQVKVYDFRSRISNDSLFGCEYDCLGNKHYPYYKPILEIYLERKIKFVSSVLSPVDTNSAQIAQLLIFLEPSDRMPNGQKLDFPTTLRRETGVYSGSKVKDVSDLLEELVNPEEKALEDFIAKCIQRHRAKERTVKNCTMGHINFWTHYNFSTRTPYADLSIGAQNNRDKNHFAFLCSLNCRAFGCEDFSCKLHCLACDDPLESHVDGYIRECTHCRRKTNIKCLVDNLSPNLSTDALDRPALDKEDADHFLQYYNTNQDPPKDPPPYFCTDCFSIEYFTPLVVTDKRIREIHRHLRVKDLVQFEQVDRLFSIPISGASFLMYSLSAVSFS
jgi:hypothetical protein